MDENITFHRKLEVPVETTPELQALVRARDKKKKNKLTTHLNRQV